MLKLAPDVFWSMTMHEFNAIAEAHEESYKRVNNVMTREELEELKKRFPDE